MNDEVTIRRRGWLVFVLILFTIIAWWPGWGVATLQSPDCPNLVLCVAFLDVGQGDAIFIQSPDGHQLLIDGGRDNAVSRRLGELMSFTDRTIDYVLLTHPDSDHIAGLIPVLERYQVDNIIRTQNESDTDVWESMEETMGHEEAKVYFAKRGQIYDLGGGVLLEILFPNIDPTNLESNTASIVARLVYGDTAFMLTGDSPQAIEEYLITLDANSLKSNVLKAGHHGSRTSSAPEFVEVVAPSYVVVSAGADNSYGHPHKEVLDTFNKAGVEVLSTAEEGNVIFVSDGQTVTEL